MSINQLRYKKYSARELVLLLESENIWFSRLISYRDNSVRQTDKISVLLAEQRNDAIDLIITATFYNNMDTITSTLLAKGFTGQQAGECKVLTRQWRITVSRHCNAVLLLKKLGKAVDEVAKSLPLMLYSSQIRRVLLNYLEVMTSANVVSIEKICREFREYPDLPKDQNLTFLVTQMTKAKWVAWLPGDDYAAVFPAHGAAVSFAKKRQQLLASNDDINIRIYVPPEQNIYKLADNKKSLRDRVSWLRTEASRLEQLLPMYDNRFLEQVK